MIEHCCQCDRVRQAGGDWFEPGLIYFKPHELLDTVCGDCRQACAAAAIRDGTAPAEAHEMAHPETAGAGAGMARDLHKTAHYTE